MKGMGALILGVALLLLFVLAGPILTIMSLNTLFPSLAIPVTLWTWLSVAWLHLITVGGITSAIKKK